MDLVLTDCYIEQRELQKLNECENYMERNIDLSVKMTLNSNLGIV